MIYLLMVVFIVSSVSLLPSLNKRPSGSTCNEFHPTLHTSKLWFLPVQITDLRCVGNRRTPLAILHNHTWTPSPIWSSQLIHTRRGKKPPLVPSPLHTHTNPPTSAHPEQQTQLHTFSYQVQQQSTHHTRTSYMDGKSVPASNKRRERDFHFSRPLSFVSARRLNGPGIAHRIAPSVPCHGNTQSLTATPVSPVVGPSFGWLCLDRAILQKPMHYNLPYHTMV